MLICRKYITLKNGTRITADQLGLKAICFEVTEEEHKAYLERRKKKQQQDK